MKLITKELLNKFKSIGSQEKLEDPLVIAKFFVGSCTWYATEIAKISFKGVTGEVVLDDINLEELEINSIKDIEFFGWVNMGDDQCAEYGYFSLAELESVRMKQVFPVERDLYCGYQTLNQHIK